jgi:hypothetical protein
MVFLARFTGIRFERSRGFAAHACGVLVTCALACALAVSVSDARAQAPQAPLSSQSTTESEWTLAEAVALDPGASCLDRTRLIAHVKMWLGGDRVDRKTRVRVHGDAVDRRKLWFEIARGKEQSRRAFEPAPESCDDVHAVMGLAIALAIDAERLQQALLPKAPELPKLRLVSLHASAAYDVLPDDSFGVGLGGELSLLSWLGVRADAFVQHSWHDTILGSRRHFAAALAAGSLSLCTGGRPDPHVRLALCTGLSLGAVHAWGTDYVPSRSDTGVWIAVRSGARIHATLGIDWLLDAEVFSAIESPAFSATRENAELVRPPSSTGFMLSLGPALLF